MFVEEDFLKFLGSNQLNLNYYFGAEHKKVEEKNIIEEESEVSDEPENFVLSSVVLMRVNTDISKSQNFIGQDNGRWK